MMTIYHLTIKAYDYWYTSDRDGFVTVDRYFSTKEKAEEWMKNNPRYILRGFNAEQTEAEKDYQMPTFDLAEITVE